MNAIETEIRNEVIYLTREYVDSNIEFDERNDSEEIELKINIFSFEVIIFVTIDYNITRRGDHVFGCWKISDCELRIEEEITKISEKEFQEVNVDLKK